MSSTIKVNNIQNLAGDDSGIDLSTNDQIILKTANTTAITVNSSQVANFANNPTVNSVPYTNAPAFLAKMSGDQSVTDENLTKVQFDTEVYDTDGKYDHSTNYRFTPTVAGTYFLHAQVNAESNANTQLADFFLILAKNNADLYVRRINFNASYVNRASLNLQVTDVANTTDYYEIFVYVNDTSGNPTLGALEPLGSGNGVASFFGAYKMIGI